MKTAEHAPDESGFTVIEMVVALTIMAFALMSLATVQFSALKALGASRQRSAFVEIGNAVMEKLRSLPESQVGLDANDTTAAGSYSGSAGSYTHNGLAAVVLPSPSGAPLAVEQVSTSPVKGITGYTIHRWVTHDPSGSGDDLRRLEVRIDWSENRIASRSFSLSSVWYPGGKGTDPPANNNPVISSATVSPGTGGVATVFTFVAVATDPDADGVSFSWQFGDGTTGSGSTVTHTYSAAGTYSALVVVRDTRGGQATASVNVSVAAAVNQPPSAQFDFASGSPNSGSAPLTVNVDASGSSDPDGDALTYSWNWGDGTTGTGVNAGHVYNSVGTYSITVTVTDPSGASAVSSPRTAQVTGGCAVLSASFKNPGTNTTSNDIKVVNSNNNKPANGQFAFTATTNLYCSNVTWSLQTTNANQRYEVTSSTATVSGGSKTWTYTGTIPNSFQFPLGALLTGFATSNGASYTFSFNAHV